MATPPYPDLPLDSRAVVSQPAVQPVVQTVSQVVVMQNNLLRDVPGQMMCPYCQINVVTTIEHTFGYLTWEIFGILLCLGCWPFCLIPFCVKRCQDVDHYCPSCNRVIHTYKRA